MDNNLRYDTDHDAVMRIAQTICRYKGKTVFVVDIVPNAKCNITFVSNEEPEGHKTIKVSYNSPDLDVSSPPIGWGNPADLCPRYFLRGAQRQQQQGLSLHKIMWFDPRNGQIGRSWSWDSYSGIEFFANMIEDKNWPSIKDLDQFPRGMALNRDWAIIRSGPGSVLTLFHQDMDVGIYNAKTKTFVFAYDAYTKTRQQSIEKLLIRGDNFSGGYHVETQS